MMKRKAIAWVLILLLVLGALSGCKQQDDLDIVAPGNTVETPETDLTEQDTPVAVEPEENKKEQEEKTEEPADQEQGEKQEETTPTQTPEEEEPAEKDVADDESEENKTAEESPAEEFDKEAWFKSYLPEALEEYERCKNSTFCYIVVYLVDFPEGAYLKEPIQPYPDFSEIEAESINEYKTWDGFYLRTFSIHPKSYKHSKEWVEDTLRKLYELDFVLRAEVEYPPELL